MKARGKQFEADLEEVWGEYETSGIALIEKVDPPVRMVRRRAIPQPSPWLDYSGSWLGRSVHIEAKERQTQTKDIDDTWLPIGRPDGLTEEQLSWMIKWGSTGAVSFLLWRIQTDQTDEIRLFGWETLKLIEQAGIDRLYWHQGKLLLTMISSKGRHMVDPLKTYQVAILKD